MMMKMVMIDHNINFEDLVTEVASKMKKDVSAKLPPKVRPMGSSGIKPIIRGYRNMVNTGRYSIHGPEDSIRPKFRFHNQAIANKISKFLQKRTGQKHPISNVSPGSESPSPADMFKNMSV